MSKSSPWSSQKVRKSKSKRTLRSLRIHVGRKANLLLLQYPDSLLRVNTEEEEERGRRRRRRRRRSAARSDCMGKDVGVFV